MDALTRWPYILYLYLYFIKNINFKLKTDVSKMDALTRWPRYVRAHLTRRFWRCRTWLCAHTDILRASCGGALHVCTHALA